MIIVMQHDYNQTTHNSKYNKITNKITLPSSVRSDYAC